MESSRRRRGERRRFRRAGTLGWEARRLFPVWPDRQRAAHCAPTCPAVSGHVSGCADDRLPSVGETVRLHSHELTHTHKSNWGWGSGVVLGTGSWSQVRFGKVSAPSPTPRLFLLRLASGLRTRRAWNLSIQTDQDSADASIAAAIDTLLFPDFEKDSKIAGKAEKCSKQKLEKDFCFVIFSLTYINIYTDAPPSSFGPKPQGMMMIIGLGVGETTLSNLNRAVKSSVSA